MDSENPSPGITSMRGWGLWQQRVVYLFTPESSAPADSAAGRPEMPQWIAHLKTLVWFGVSLAAALTIAQL